jgi:hypothetical protein
MINFIELLNFLLGLSCLIGAIEGLVNEEWMQVCAFCLFYIAFNQAVTSKEPTHDTR